METLIIILFSVSVPSFAFAANWVARIQMGYELSAAADFVLAIAMFDLSAVGAHDVFEKAMTNTVFQKDFVALFLVFTIGTLFVWFAAFLRLEAYIEKLQISPQSADTRKRVRKFTIGSWALVAVVMAPHVFAFAYR